MPSVVVTATAERNLRSLMETHSLAPATNERVRASLEPLRAFLLLGSPLSGCWTGFRYVLGPWRWMLIVYRYVEDHDRVEVVTVRDSRTARSPTRLR